MGFTSGIALVIFASQVRDLLGLRMETPPADFVEKWIAYARAMPSADLRALAVAGLAVAIVVWWPRVSHRVPGPLVALVAATALVQLAGVPIETIGSRFGEVPSMLPRPAVPRVSWETVTEMFTPGVAIALLAAIESLLSAVVADGMAGTRHRSNMELVAQGVANLISPLFGGIPATGAIARTATNVKNGGRTPLAGIVHAATLLFIMLFFGKWAALIPLAALAGILVVVSYNMSEWRLFLRLFRGQKSDIAVLLTTFLLTVFIDITVALEAGMVLASLLFMRRMASVTQTRHVTRMLEEEDEGQDPNAVAAREIPPGVEVFEIHGPFFFGAASSFKDAISAVEKPPKVLILRVRHVLTMDGTALRALEDVVPWPR